MVLPRNERTPTSGGKLVGVLVCDGEDMRPDLASSRAKWNPPKNRLPKMPKDTFSVGVRYHDPTGKARALRTEIRRRIRKLPVRATAAK